MHAAAPNYYPQRTVRNDRYKLIENLLPDQVNPGYEFTNGRFEGVLAAIEAAPDTVRDAYHRMQKPPRFELYDLRSDPYERAEITSNTYFDWMIDRAFLLVPAQEYVGNFLMTFKDYPPRMKAASFSLDKVMEIITTPGGAQ